MSPALVAWWLSVDLWTRRSCFNSMVRAHPGGWWCAGGSSSFPFGYFFFFIVFWNKNLNICEPHFLLFQNCEGKRCCFCCYCLQLLQLITESLLIAFLLILKWARIIQLHCPPPPPSPKTHMFWPACLATVCCSCSCHGFLVHGVFGLFWLWFDIMSWEISQGLKHSFFSSGKIYICLYQVAPGLRTSVGYPYTQFPACVNPCGVNCQEQVSWAVSPNPLWWNSGRLFLAITSVIVCVFISSSFFHPKNVALALVPNFT